MRFLFYLVSIIFCFDLGLGGFWKIDRDFVIFFFFYIVWEGLGVCFGVVEGEVVAIMIIIVIDFNLLFIMYGGLNSGF